MKIEIISEFFRMVLAVSRLITLLMTFFPSVSSNPTAGFFVVFLGFTCLFLSICTVVQHDVKAGSNKTDYSGVKLLLLRRVPRNLNLPTSCMHYSRTPIGCCGFSDESSLTQYSATVFYSIVLQTIVRQG